MVRVWSNSNKFARWLDDSPWPSANVGESIGDPAA
jgi:hypothetical protein